LLGLGLGYLQFMPDNLLGAAKKYNFKKKYNFTFSH